ncbi:MAG: DUF1566 domain-containing protein [Proteobacteria bacterium]|nr:DUF1566 domain-containing protein [Pseudomonadota bacterium]
MRKRILLGVFVLLLLSSINVFASPVPDTGQTQSYTSTFGEDSDYTINPPYYTKLDANGNDLPVSATSWAMVLDNVTGLIWEEKNNKDSVKDYTNPNDADNTYTWYDSNPATNGGFAGTPGDGTDTEDFINALNANNYGGFSDWRLPTIKELSFIADKGRTDPAINPTYFPDTPNGAKYWSSSTNLHEGTGYNEYAWCVYFDYSGYVSGTFYKKSTSFYVRAVRGAQSNQVLKDNGDGVVTDLSTGLMWQKDGSTQKDWEGALSYCETLTLAGYNDWRLPNVNELQSLVDYSRGNPCINTTYFSISSSAYDYWASTTHTSKGSCCAYEVHFNFGNALYSGKTYTINVRAVRGPVPTLIELSSFTASPANHQIIIRWETESEIDNAGFNLYRAEAEDGEYFKINSYLIPAEGSPTQGASYEFIDKDVKNRRTYYYKLEDIDLNGNNTMHGPMSATPRQVYRIDK